MAFGCIMTGGSRNKGTASSDKVLEGETFSSIYGKDLTGVMKNNGVVEKILDRSHKFIDLEGYYAPGSNVSVDLMDGVTVALKTQSQSVSPDTGKLLGIVTVPGVPGSATPAMVLGGATFSSSNGVNITGSMSNFSATTANGKLTEDGTYIYLSIPNNGYYDVNSKLRASAGSIDPSSIGRTLVWTSSPQDLSKIFPTTYKQLTTSDFICGTTNTYVYEIANYGPGFPTTSTASSCSYDSSTGILTFGWSNVVNRRYRSDDDKYWDEAHIEFGTVFCAYKGSIAGAYKM